jgi:pimeloyl-ACP methyl ester carboxylesterase
MKAPLVCVLTLGLAAVSALEAGQLSSVRDPDQIAGWYDLAGLQVLVSWGPRDGYRLLDFERARFHRLNRAAGDGYVLSGDGPWRDAKVEVVRDASAGPVSLTLALTTGEVIRAPRAVERSFDVEEASFRSGDATLGGPLLVPRVRKLVGKTGRPLTEVPLPLPAVVVLHGSGDSDRDNVWAFTFAQAMARAGFVTLFTDKRGAGASSGDWRRVGLEGLTDDALAGVAFLRHDRRVDPKRVGLIGLSQGGLVAALGVGRDPGLAFAVTVSCGPIPLFTQMQHEMTQELRKLGVPPAGIEAVIGTGQLAAAYSRSPSEAAWTRYEASLAALRAGSLAPAAAGFPSDRGDWRWSWWRAVGDVDPLPAWRQYRGPALALFGEEDEEDNVPVRASVERLHDAWLPEISIHKTIRVFPQRGHTLVDPARGWVDRDILTFMTDWALRAVGGLDPGG